MILSITNLQASVVILFFITILGIAVMAYFIVEAITAHWESKNGGVATPQRIAAAKIQLEIMAIELQCMRENLTDAEREIKLAEIKQNPNAIIIGYKDKPRKTRRNPNITIQGATHE